MGPLVRLAALLLGVTITLAVSAGPAAAHPTLLFTTPAADSAVPDSPTSLVLVFNERVTVGPAALVLADATARTYPVEVAGTARGGTVATAAVPHRLQTGGYVVRWRVTGEDGDVVENEFRFTVGAAVSGQVAGETLVGGSGAGGMSWISAVLRWAMFAGLAMAFGGIVARRFAAVPLLEDPRLPRVRSWAAAGAVGGFAAAGVLAVLLVGEVRSFRVLWAERPGQVLLAEAAGFAAAARLLIVRRWGWAVGPLLLVAAAEGVRSHAEGAEPGWGALLTAVHLTAAAIWLGALVVTARTAVAWRYRPPAVRWMIVGYARAALWLFLAVVTTGTLTALILLPPPALITLTTTTYGRLLLVKVALVTLAAVIAGGGRVALRRPDHRLGSVRRLARGEAVVLVGVLALAATLVATPPAGAEQQAPPPAAAGPTYQTGALAGQIGTNIAASEGQLVVRLATPRRGDYYGPDEQQQYTLAAQFAPAGGTAEALRFTPCGRGCFLAAPIWRTGDNVLTLRAGAAGWTGGDVAVTVPWPVRPAEDLVGGTVAAMRALDRFTVYETVISDSAAAPPEPRRLPMTGDSFIGLEPYGSGVAPVAVAYSRNGFDRLAMAFPAEGRTAEVTVGPDGRIIAETLSDPKHLILRRFVYEDAA